MNVELPGAQAGHFDLLHKIGVHTFENLRSEDPQVLHVQLANMKADNPFVADPPEPQTIERWIEISHEQELSGRLPTPEEYITGAPETDARDMDILMPDAEAPGEPGKDDW